ncbi:hypothetical protein [Bryobacter aggregatus]|uniref:hypothetical protein n=1 Tax=Bryobacter aggregatus TaxID=360054 RepID=UPI0004E1167B|nr:hypothetical protein [Bryobacter aggregatus]
MPNPIGHLIGAMLESESAFRAAASRTKNRNWRSMFEHYAIQRREFAQQLHPFLEEPEPLETATPISLSNGDTQSILEELIHSGNRTDAAFRKAIAGGKLGDATAVVREQAVEVEHSLQQLQSLISEPSDSTGPALPITA